MVHGMRGLPAHPGSHSLNVSGQGPFNLGHVVALQRFLHKPSSPRSRQRTWRFLAATRALC